VRSSRDWAPILAERSNEFYLAEDFSVPETLLFALESLVPFRFYWVVAAAGPRSLSPVEVSDKFCCAGLVLGPGCCAKPLGG
jgi:hypothetical protein